MTDQNGSSLETSEYLPFGSSRTQSGAVQSAYKYTDQEIDAETGLYNYDARLYDPVIGRFITADSIVPGALNPQALNRYSYCYNNPLIYVDPTGHISWESAPGAKEGVNGGYNNKDSSSGDGSSSGSKRRRRHPMEGKLYSTGSGYIDYWGNEYNDLGRLEKLNITQTTVNGITFNAATLNGVHYASLASDYPHIDPPKAKASEAIGIALEGLNFWGATTLIGEMADTVYEMELDMKCGTQRDGWITLSPFNDRGQKVSITFDRFAPLIDRKKSANLKWTFKGRLGCDSTTGFPNHWPHKRPRWIPGRHGL